jgi:catechol 2,3-dioxygenase-like lactoylglutathione lyase family enzyme
MIDHLSISVSDMTKARAFYDAVLATVGAKRVMNAEDYASGYGTDWKPVFWIGADKPALNGHIAFAAADRGTVDAFYNAAIAAGATDNGAPGLRPRYHENYYGAFVIDPDGNRLEAVCHKPV